PPASGAFASRAAARAKLTAGRLLAWVGRQLGSAGLARLGGDLARRALEQVPRLSEKVFGAQEAALRDVLRELQSGDVEKGLRRAPVAVPDPDQRPARVGTDADLGRRDPRYSLRSLLGGGGGVATAWLGGHDVWAELAREYRRLAEEAVARGDFRRAAYLYGVLLRDLRAAVNALLRGGQYRDAAVLLRDKLADPRGAAAAFERAGDFDEALRLYDLVCEFERAGDLLRTLGDDARALRYFTRAADHHAEKGRHLVAGDLMSGRAQRRDLAAGYYRAGWRCGAAEAVTCAQRLIDEYLLAEDFGAFDRLLTEAAHALADRPRDTGRLFNYALGLGDDFLPADARADLRDRAKLLFAGHLRTAGLVGEGSALADELFAGEGPWPAPVGRDALFATRGQAAGALTARRPGGETSAEPDRRLVNGEVTAAAVARWTGDVVVAASGQVVCWRVSAGAVVPVGQVNERVHFLSTTARGEVVYAVTSRPNGTWLLRAFVVLPDGNYQPTVQVTLPTGGVENPPVYLQPEPPFRAGEFRLTVAARDERLGLAGPYLLADTDPMFEGGDGPARLLVETADGWRWMWTGGMVVCRAPDDRLETRWPAPCVPASPVDWLTPAPGVLQVAAVTALGGLIWHEFNGTRPQGRPEGRGAGTGPPERGDYQTACLCEPGLVAASTTRNEVHWLRAAGRELTAVGTVTVRVPSRVFALVARPTAGEVVAVLADGSAVRVRRP
ncbi:MAG: hypothetical protein K2V38_06700, partial [Gemmataceae bacterium]|nr:hypothetical protein [Gemmataceae bacterium]